MELNVYWKYGAALLVSLVATPAFALLGLDSTPPTVTIVKPASGAAVSGQAALEVRAEDGLLGSGVNDQQLGDIFSSRVHGDPETPVFTAKAGTQVRFRVVQPSGHARQRAFNLHGAEWIHDAWADGSGSDWLGTHSKSCAMSTQDGMSVMKAWNFTPLYGAGGANAIPGDYMYRDQPASMLADGLWGIVRVQP